MEFDIEIPPLTEYIRGILNKYPDGGQILKELVQNAEDAGADSLTFILDHREYGEEELIPHGEGREKVLVQGHGGGREKVLVQGPALYAFNNAVFTQEDWAGIAKLGSSQKKNKIGKVGKFGIGFSSVYHLTDCPWILSGNLLAVLDPQRLYFPRSKKWDFSQHQHHQEWSQAQDQAEPWRTILDHLGLGDVFEGAELPGTLFRFPLRTSPSELSSTEYPPRRVLENLFSNLISDLEIVPLFLNNIKSIKLEEILHNNQTRMICEVNVAEVDEGQISISIQNQGAQQQVSRFHIRRMNLTERRSSPAFQEALRLSEDLKLLPEVAVAARIDAKDCREGSGRISVMLPLPDSLDTRTGLPVFINGFFALSDNRRSLKWMTEDDQSAEVQWNKLLVQKVIPVCYAELISQVTRGPDADTSYSLWPDLLSGSNWFECSTNTLVQLWNLQSLKLTNGQWIVPKQEERVIFDTGFTIPNGQSLSNQCSSRIRDFLGDTTKKIVPLYREDLKNVLRLIQTTWGPRTNNLVFLNPNSLSEICLQRKDQLRSSPQEVKDVILMYVGLGGGDLANLPLLPLLSGEVMEFSHNNKNKFFVPSSQVASSCIPSSGQQRVVKISTNEDTAKGLEEVLSNLAKRGSYGLQQLTVENLPQILRDALQSTWLQATSVAVNWDPNSSDQPSITNIQSIWRLLNTQPSYIYKYEGIPLIPSVPLDQIKHQTQNQLLKMKRSRKLAVVGDMHQSTIPKLLKDLAKEKILTWDPSKSLCPALLNVYVEPLDGLRLLNILEEVRKGPGYLVSTLLNNTQTCQDIVSYLHAHNYQISKSHIDLLKYMPLLGKIDGTFCSYVNHHPNRLLYSSQVPPMEEQSWLEELGITLIYCPKGDQRWLASNILSISILNNATLAMKMLEKLQNHVSLKDQEKKIVWISQHVAAGSFQSALKNIPFIPSGKEYFKMNALFSHDDERLGQLFLNETNRFMNEGSPLRNISNLLQLKSWRDVTINDLQQTAKIIEMSNCKNLNHGKLKALLEKSKELNKLTSIVKFKIFPSMPKPTNHPSNLGWVSDESSLYTGGEVFGVDFHDVVGSVGPVCHPVFSSYLVQSGNERKCTTADLVNQLKNIVRQNVSIQATAKIYSLLHRYGAANIKETSRLLAGVPNGKWIATTDGFRSLKEVSFDPAVFNFHPYIAHPTKEIIDAQDFFQKLGIRGSLSSSDLSDILEDIQEYYRKIPFFQTEKWDIDSQVILHILNKLTDEKSTRNNNIIGKLNLPLVKTKKIVFCPIKDCFYYDVKNKKQKELIQSSCKSYNIVALRIDNKLGEALKLRPVTDVLLNVTELVNENTFGVEEWGQQESITQRIKGILDEYPEGSGIYKEMIQNADDAGATEVAFFIDEQENKDARATLMDTKMEICNGMSLWAYNDAKFEESDFQNLIKIGGATKRSESDKIGAFGLGFNSVYHLTDVPSIVSGKYLVYLDPNLTHIPLKYTPSKSPGIRINIKEDPEKLDMFADQFKPYNIPLFNLKLESRPSGIDYNGTVIRLPLRNQRGADKSEISDVVYDSRDLSKLSKWFQNSQKDYLLFLPNIKKLTLWRGDSRMNPNKIACVTKEVNRTGSNFGQKKSIIKAASEFVHKDSSNSPPKQNQIVTIDIQSETQIKSTWIISSICADKSSETFCLAKEKSKSHGLNPVTSIAIKIGINQANQKLTVQSLREAGNAFCYLPLNIPTGLNFHINGSFSVSSNRRNLWKDEGCEETVRGNWNKYLLDLNLVDNLVEALEYIKGLQKNGELDIEKFDLLWPNVFRETETLHSFSVNFYNRILENNCRLFYSEESKIWCTFDNCYMLDMTEVPKNVLSDVKSLLLKILKNQNPESELVTLSAKSKLGLERAYGKEQFKEKIYNAERFCTEIFFPNFGYFDLEPRETIIHFVLEQQSRTPESYLEKIIKSTTCIPSSCKGTLRKPDDIIDQDSEVGKLFVISDDRFLEKSYIKHKSVLYYLGLNHCLSEEIYKERAHFIQSADERIKSGMLSIESILNISDTLLLQLSQSITESNVEKWKTICASLSHVKYLQRYQEIFTGFFAPAQLWSPDVEDYVSFSKPVFKPPVVPIQSSFLYLSKRKIMYSVLNIQNIVTEEDIVQQMMSYEKKFQNETLNTTTQDAIGKKINQNLNKLAEYDISRESLEMIKDLPLYYHGNKLYHISDIICENSSYDLSPFLLQIKPSSISSEMAKLLKTLGMIEIMGQSEYCNLLYKIQESSDEVLDKACLGKVEHVLEQLAALMKNSDIVNNEELIAPNEEGILTPVSELLYNDAPWIKMTGNFIHKSISRQTAVEIGVKMIKSKALESFQSGSFPFGDPFGQQEPLTTRIKNILEEYPSEIDIFKEMLQNADDAEASEIHFIVDERILKTEKVFNDNWHQIQGPALCVFNNKPFTESDYDGIRKLGIGSKRTIAHTIGKYGIGFNSVYQITDTPMFISNQSLVVFDPHIDFVTGVASKDNPGGKFDLTPEFSSTYADVLSGFEFSNLSLKLDSENGTLFRLPLRQNYESKIKNKRTDPTEIKQIVEQFKMNAEEHLLFLKNVKEIKISHLNADGTLEESFLAISSVDEKKERERQQFFTNSKNRDMVNLNCSYDLNVKISKAQNDEKRYTHKTISKYKVCWRIEDRNEMATAFESDISAIPLGAVALKRNSFSTKSKLFVGLPLPEQTDLPVHINGSFALDHGRRGLLRWDTGSWNSYILSYPVCKAYLDLFILIRDELQTKQLHHKVREIDMFKKEKSTLNTEKQAFANEKRSEHMGKFFEELFPSVPKEMEAIFPLVQSLYNKIMEKQIEIIPCYSVNVVENVEYQKIVWAQLDKCFFVNEHMDQYFYKKQPKALTLLCKINCYIPTSPRLSSKFCLVQQIFMSQESIISFLKDLSDEQFFPDGTRMTPRFPVPINSTVTNVKEVNSLLQFILKYKEVKRQDRKSVEKYAEDEECKTELVDLTGVPLLATCDKKLQRFSKEATVFKNKWHSLLPGKAGHFIISGCPEDKLSEDFCKELTIQHLKDYIQDITPKLQEGDLLQFKFDILEFIVSTYSCPDNIINWDHKAKHKAKFVRVLEDYDLLPVTVSGRKQFTKLSNIFNTLWKSPYEFQYDSDIASDLEKLGMSVLKIENPKLRHTSVESKQQTSDLENNMHNFFSNICANIGDWKSILHSLDCLLQSDDDANFCLKSWPSLCKKLQKCFTLIPKPEHVAHIIKRIPIFFSLSNGVVSITSLSEFAYCPEWTSGDEMIIPGIDILTGENNSDLFCILKIKEKTTFEVYRSYILPALEDMNMEERIHHLEVIASFYSHENINNDRSLKLSDQLEILLSNLSNISCIENIPGEVVTVKSLVSNRSKLLDMISKDHEKINPKFVCKEAMYNLFLKLGLRTEVTKEGVLRFIEEQLIPFKKNMKMEEYSKFVAKLVDEIFSNENLMRDQDFLKQISLLEFIPCHLSLWENKLCKEGGYEKKLISFSGSSVYGASDYIWSVLPVLPYWASPNKNYKGADTEFQLKNLNIIQKENISHPDLIKHFTFFCESCKTLKLANLDLTDIYPKLVQNLEKIQPAQLKEGLFRVNCISINGDMVKPQQTVFNCSLNVEPYMYKFPIEHGNLLKIFTMIGVSEEISVRHCADAMEMIAINTQSQRIIDPNVRKIIKDLFEEFCSLFLKSEGKCNDETRLFLPSEDFELLDSQQLTFNDFPAAIASMRDSLTFVATNNKFGQVIDMLPLMWRPNRLSKKIETRILEKNSCTCSSSDCHGAAQLKSLLSSPLFSEGIIRLMKHYKESHENYNLPDINIDTFSHLTESMKQVRVTCYEVIKTVIHDLNDDSEIKNTEASKAAAVLDGDYIELAVSHKILQHAGSGYGMCNKLAEEVIYVIKKTFDEDEGGHWSILMNFLSQIVFLRPNTIEQFLDKENIQTMESLAEREDHFEAVGHPIPMDVVSCLQQDPFLPISVDKIIAYQKENGIFVYAKVKVILEQIGTNLYKIIINAGDDIYEEVTSLDIYHFPLLLPKKENVVQKLWVNNDDVSEGIVPDESTKYDESAVPDEGKFDRGLEITCKEITEQLEEAFTSLCSEDKKKMIRRLYLRWHPDKNMKNVDIATEVTKHIQNEVDRLEKGLPRKSNQSSGNFTRGEDFSDFWDSFFRSWDNMAQNQGRKRERYYHNYWRGDNCGSHGGYQNRDDTWDVPPSFETNNIPAARTWLNQAKADLDAAKTVLDHNQPDFEWVAFIARMAMERSVKSAELCAKTFHCRSHDIAQLAANLPTSLNIREDLVAAWDLIPSVFKNYNNILYQGLDSRAGSTSREFCKENAQDIRRGVAMAERNFIRIVEEHLKGLEEED